ncbi:MAG: hypothetical protein KF730_08270 [Sphingomonas sp.]|uniref:hypothetical protein n=1 Tax=Sphingomonas sp. TaxID=28214 RepID=UPI0025E38C20|nr:hypothetical protein [Sphingomonas sp.]MBX3564555.1 hypothetical protein [Sphingomonas sp.]
MRAIRVIGGLLPLFAAMPVCAQGAKEPRLNYSIPLTETKVTLDERAGGLWLRAQTVMRGESGQGGADGRNGYRFSVQKRIIGPAWIGFGGYTQMARFDAVRGQTRGARNTIGPKLSFEAGEEVEFGIAWMKRRKRGGVPPGPRAYVQFHF